jgi:glycogen debranching enzyme
MISETSTDMMGEVTCVRGEVFVVSGATGDIVPGGDHGFYVRDTRFLDRLEVLIDGMSPRPLTGSSTGPASAMFHAYAPAADVGPDPTLLIDRRRVIDSSLHEEVRLTNRGRRPVHVEVGLRVGTDFAYIFDVRHDRSLDPAIPLGLDGGVRFIRADEVDELLVTTQPRPQRREGSTLIVPCELAPGGSWRVCLDVVATDVYGTVRPDGRCDALPTPSAHADRARDQTARVACSDHRFARLLERSLADLEALQLADPLEPADVFCAAGSPWYLTLFGRDSLWAAFMAAPFDLALAGGTLRTLARRQGTRHDPDTEEQPGKILHEIRRGSLTHRGDLPPNYYGTIDATPLFVVLAHEAWLWGLPEAQVADLLPHVEAALEWMRAHGDPDHDGFLEYIKNSERGLDNQGWKDSHDGIQFADGRLASPPIALAEVQGYAYDAALRGAALLDRFARPGAADWREWAAGLQARFRGAFWIRDEAGRYPAIALDRDHTPVDGPASNMGHLLATGLLDDREVERVARQLADSHMASGWGLRTLSSTSAGFNPLSYHGGSVWPHDTAIAVWGLAISGQQQAASSLLRGLLDAAPSFGYRLPELFAGFARQSVPVPVPYPAACRPQAWAAGGALLLLRSCLRLQPAIPEGRLTIAPLQPFPFAHLEVDGLPVAGRSVSIRIDERHGIDVEVNGEPLEINILAGDTAVKEHRAGA